MALKFLPAVMCILEAYMIWSFFDIICDHKERRKGNAWLILGVLPFYIYAANHVAGGRLNLLFIPVGIFLTGHLLFDVKPLMNLVLTILLFSIAFVIEGLFEFIYRAVFGQVMIGKVSIIDEHHAFLMLIENIAIFSVSTFAARLYKRRYRSDKISAFQSLFFLLPVSTIIVLTGILLSQPVTEAVSLLMVLGCFLLVLTNIMIFFALDKLEYYRNQERENQLTAMQLKHYEQQKKAEDEYKNLIHDFHNSLGALREMANNSKSGAVDDMLDDWGRREKAINENIYSTNAVLDAILREQSGRAEEKGIDFSVSMEPGMDFDVIQPTDMISMVGNLISNAVDAASERKDGFVDVEARMGSPYYMVFLITNNYEQEPRKRAGSYITSKKDASLHGRGIINATKMAQSYGGDLQVSVDSEKKEFQAILRISVHRAKNR